MSSLKFERVKTGNPGISDLLDRMGAYVRAQISAGQDFIVPRLAGAALGLNDGEAFVLLDLLAQGGVLTRVYNVYCREHNMLLATVDSLEALDDIPHCDYCDKDHQPSELKVEIAFTSQNGDFLNLAA